MGIVVFGLALYAAVTATGVVVFQYVRYRIRRADARARWRVEIAKLDADSQSMVESIARLAALNARLRGTAHQEQQRPLDG